MTLNGTLTDVPGVLVGHFTHRQGATGVTVILCPPKTVGSVEVRGGAPGTRETDLLQPHNLVQEVNAIVLSGGSAYGLASADGVVRFLADRKQGYMSSAGYLVPIVAGAIIFDLRLGEQGIVPDAPMGYMACVNASNKPVPQGNVGAGTGAICGAMRGKTYATKGGLGSASVDLGGGLIVSAVVVVNAVGDIIDEQGRIIAGLRGENGEFVGMLNALKALRLSDQTGTNTVIGCIATNAKLTKLQAHKVAQMAHDGIARAVNPAHTMYDGDTVFAIATGEIEADVNLVGAFGAEVMAQAIRSAVYHAETLDGVRAARD